MSLPAIVQYWHSDRPPRHVVKLLETFSRCNPGAPHLVFDEAKADEFLAQHFSARELSAFRTCAVPAMQADYFRYCAVYALGGFYSDADFECLEGVGSMLDEGSAGILFGQQKPIPGWLADAYGWPYDVGPYQAVDNGVFAFAHPRHPLLGTVIEIATANIERRIADGPPGIWLTAGPGVLTSMYLLLRLGSIDAFIRYSAGTALEPAVPVFCEIVENPARLAEMFDRVDIRPRDLRDRWVRAVPLPPQWGTVEHWWTTPGSIFR
jgi:hypothetical protein